jgi:p-aminobenzoyl-glutamate transporter AbgT
MADNKKNNVEQVSGEGSPGQGEAAGTRGFLRWIEDMGNKLPHPFWIFVWICILIVLTSAVTAWLG